ncbi:TylF/MycF/NovP-related O-methyltransferase [Candidatus Latescibacterota bacterium]
MKKMIKGILHKLGFEIRKIYRVRDIPDSHFYSPLFSPWLGYGKFKEVYEMAKHHTSVSSDRCYVLYTLASQALFLEGDIWECGVYKGGTAILFAELIASTKGAISTLHLFDTFQGMPETDPKVDLHQRGDFADTSLPTVRKLIRRKGIVRFHEGDIPDTFEGLEASQIAFAHIDVDIYRSVLDCCEFIIPRLVNGGFVVFDDYGFPSCPGARKAVNEFFRDRPEKPLVLPTGQAIVFNSF